MGCKSSKPTVVTTTSTPMAQRSYPTHAESVSEINPMPTVEKHNNSPVDPPLNRLECVPVDTQQKSPTIEMEKSSDASCGWSHADISAIVTPPHSSPDDSSMVAVRTPNQANKNFEENTDTGNKVAKSKYTFIPNDNSASAPSNEATEPFRENTDEDNSTVEPLLIIIPNDTSTVTTLEATQIVDEPNGIVEKAVFHAEPSDKSRLVPTQPTGIAAPLSFTTNASSDDAETSAIDRVKLFEKPCLKSDLTAVVTPAASPANTPGRRLEASDGPDRIPPEFTEEKSSEIQSDVCIDSNESETPRVKSLVTPSLSPINVPCGSPDESPTPSDILLEGKGSEILRTICIDRNESKMPSPVKTSTNTQHLLPEPISLSTEFELSTNYQKLPPPPKQIEVNEEKTAIEGMGSNLSQPPQPAPPPPQPHPHPQLHAAIGRKSFSSYISYWGNPSDDLKKIYCLRYIMEMTTWSGFNFVPIVCAILTFVLHVITINGEFVWDDRAAVLSNPDVLCQRSLLELLRHDFWGQAMALETSHKSWRPAAVFSLRMSYELYGPDAHGFHLHNVILHAVVAYCYSVFCFQLTKSYMKETKKTARNTAILASFIFAVHPIHTEPVASIVGRSDLLCGFFFILAIILHRAGRKEMKSRYMALATFCAILSTLSKEVGVTVFGMFAASDIIDLLSAHGYILALNKPMLEALARHTAVNFTCAVLLTAFHLSLHGDVKIYNWSKLENSISLLESTSASERMLSYAHIVALYFWKMVCPSSLSYDWGWPCVNHVTSVADFRNLGTLLVVVVMLSIGWYSLKQRNAILLWSLAMMIIPFLPASNLFFPVGTILAERLLYIPSMGFCLCAGYFMAHLLNGNPFNGIATERNVQFPRKVKGVSFIILCAYIFWMSLKTIHRCTEWSTEEKLFGSGLRVCPRSLKVLNNYAQLFLKTDPRRAISFLDDAIELHEHYASAHFNKGIAHDNLGEPLESIDSFTKSLALNPNDGRVRHLLGGALLSRAKTLMNNGNDGDAEEHLLRAMGHVNDSIENIDAKNPRALHLRCEIGNALSYDAAENLRYCTSSLEANRENNSTKLEEDVTLNLLGVISKQMGEYTDAAEYFSTGLTVNPASYDLLLNLASVHSDTSNYELANSYFEQAEALLSSKSDQFRRSYLLANRGWLMEKQGLRMDARELYAQAIGLSQPNPHPQIVTNLQNIDKFCENNHCE